jgi:beta-lactamase class A
MRREVIMTTISRTLVLALVMMLLVPVAFAQDSHLAILREKTESALEEIAAKTGSVLGVAALDLTSGESFEINEDFVFPQGSSIKIPIMMEVWKQAKEGKFSLEERRPVPKQVMVGGSGALQFFSDGRSELSIRDLAVLMIILSDNTATNILIDLVGTDRINATMSSLGLTKTRVQRQMMDVAASAREDENLSTTFEAVEIMKTLHDGSFIDREACDQMLEILKYPKGGGIKRGLPSGVPIAFKGGGSRACRRSGRWSMPRTAPLP